eukprot:GHVU01061355.1.p2 GENE.GHVU01061355.1~~GHVU01061355.1.p2  ORF type:complete len:111 (+),score=5.94 GHVU01061355.1:152-484(+)
MPNHRIRLLAPANLWPNQIKETSIDLAPNRIDPLTCDSNCPTVMLSSTLLLSFFLVFEFLKHRDDTLSPVPLRSSTAYFTNDVKLPRTHGCYCRQSKGGKEEGHTSTYAS